MTWRRSAAILPHLATGRHPQSGLGWQFSVAAASITLAIISLPYVSRATEVALAGVPQELREAAYGMGAGAGTVTFRICMRVALPGVLTGVLLALAVSVGETAPLLYTAGWSNYAWNGQLTGSPIGYLTYVIWAFITMSRSPPPTR